MVGLTGASVTGAKVGPPTGASVGSTGASVGSTGALVGGDIPDPLYFDDGSGPWYVLHHQIHQRRKI